jgi:undecaprenol kinase
MVNTAIERCVDLITKDYKELAKLAKDIAAGSVLIMSLFSIIIGIIIFLPKILEILGGK